MHKRCSVGSLNASECYSHWQLEARPLINPANDDSCCIDSSFHPLFHQLLLVQYFASVNTGIETVDPGCLRHWSHLWCWDTTFSLFVWWLNPFMKLADGTKWINTRGKNWSMKLTIIDLSLKNVVILHPGHLTWILQETRKCVGFQIKILQRNVVLCSVITV